MTPLERAARALVDDLTRQANLDGSDAPYIYDDALPESVGVDGRIDCTASARAVLEAIRDPSEAMIKAAWSEASEGGDPPEIYAAMIDALLEEGR